MPRLALPVPETAKSSDFDFVTPRTERTDAVEDRLDGYLRIYFSISTTAAREPVVVTTPIRTP